MKLLPEQFGPSIEGGFFPSFFIEQGCSERDPPIVPERVVEVREITFEDLGFTPPVPLPLSFGPPVS